MKKILSAASCVTISETQFPLTAQLESCSKSMDNSQETTLAVQSARNQWPKEQAMQGKIAPCQLDSEITISWCSQN